MSLTPSDFRRIYSEFADYATYSDAVIQYWIDLGYKFLPEDRWGELLDFGVGLFTAHYMKIGGIRGGGGDSSIIAGPITSQHVGEVGMASSPAFITIANAGLWNTTSYGIQFYQLAKMFGSGGQQI